MLPATNKFEFGMIILLKTITYVECIEELRNRNQAGGPQQYNGARSNYSLVLTEGTLVS
jgi:hypothetical protein